MIFALLPLLALIASSTATPLYPRQVVVDPTASAIGDSTNATTAGTDAPAATSAATATDAALTAASTRPSADTYASSAVSDSGNTTSTGAAANSADLTVVKFAALAESLESKFYAAALAKFTAQSFTDAGFADGQGIIDQLTVIQVDESTHLSTLQSVATSLGASTSELDSCTFNFDAALSDITTFLATARVLEFVGIDAYIGGATLIEDKSLLVSAAEILTVEARHNTILNTFNAGSSVPSAFDMVLTPQQVLSIAAPFLSGGCDPVAALELTPTPQLSVTNTGPVTPGTLVTFAGAGLDGKDQSTLFCNMIVGGATEALVFPVSSCVVPDGLDGPVHLFVTNAATPLSSNIVSQDASLIVAGPAVAFIDTIPNAQSALLKGQGSANQGQFNVSSESNSSGTVKKIVITKVVVKNS